MADFVKVAQTSDLALNSAKTVKVNGTDVALVNLAGQIYAIGDTCPHAHCSLGDGDVEGENIVCPCHASEFNIKTGAVEDGPAREGVPSYPVRVDGDDILVAV